MHTRPLLIAESPTCSRARVLMYACPHRAIWSHVGGVAGGGRSHWQCGARQVPPLADWRRRRWPRQWRVHALWWSAVLVRLPLWLRTPICALMPAGHPASTRNGRCKSITSYRTRPLCAIHPTLHAPHAIPRPSPPPQSAQLRAWRGVGGALARRWGENVVGHRELPG